MPCWATKLDLKHCVLGFQLNGDYVQKGAHDFLYDFIIEVDYIEFSGLVNITLISPYHAPSLFILAGAISSIQS